MYMRSPSDKIEMPKARSPRPGIHAINPTPLAGPSDGHYKGSFGPGTFDITTVAFDTTHIMTSWPTMPGNQAINC